MGLSAPADARRTLREHLRDVFGARDVALFATGTQALTVAVRSALDGCNTDRIVALPAYNCFDVASAAVGADARIIFYDIDAETLSPDWNSFEESLARGACAAVVASLYGFPVDWQRAEKIAAKHGTTLIEDAAQGMGGEWNGAPLGSLGRMSILSFGRGKGWTGGGGGALLIRDSRDVVEPDAQTGLLPEFTTVAKATAQWFLSAPHLFKLPASLPMLRLGETVYKPPMGAQAMCGYSAALVAATAGSAREECSVRAHNASRLDEALTHAGLNTFKAAPNGTAGYLRYPLRIPSPTARVRVLEILREDGVAQGYPVILSALQELRSCVVERRDYPGARQLVRELITVPTHSRTDPRTPTRLASLLKSLPRT